MKTNYHMHTVWCDGRNTVEEMIRAAIDRGFDEIGFSSHARLPDVVEGERVSRALVEADARGTAAAMVPEGDRHLVGGIVGIGEVQELI